MNCIKKSILVIASMLTAAMIRPIAAYAACPPGTRDVGFEFACIPNDPIGFVEQLYSIGLGLIGMVALLFMIYGGYQILTSRGDPEALEKGRGYIMYSIIGLIMAVFGFVILQVIAGDILRIPGFSN